MIRRLQQGTVPREDFETRFADLVSDLTKDRAVKFVGAAEAKPVEKATRPK